MKRKCSLEEKLEAIALVEHLKVKGKESSLMKKNAKLFVNIRKVN